MGSVLAEMVYLYVAVMLHVLLLWGQKFVKVYCLWLFLQTKMLCGLLMQEIFSSWTHKTEHFQRIHRNTGVPFASMLFFDDEDRNIEAVNLPFWWPFEFSFYTLY